MKQKTNVYKRILSWIFSVAVITTSFGANSVFAEELGNELKETEVEVQEKNESVEAVTEAKDLPDIDLGIVFSEEEKKETELEETKENTDVVDSQTVGEQAKSGTCGAGLTWNLDEAGVLSISGSGEMEDFSEYPYAPWYQFRSSIKSVEIGKGVSNIGASAFGECENMSSVSLPDSVTRIEYWGFGDCYCLQKIQIPTSVQSIGESAFESCQSMENLIIPSGVKDMGEYAFSFCKGLKRAVIKGDIQTIKPWTFWLCDHLKKVEIPSSVTNIRYGAFYNTIALSDVYYGGTKAEWEEATKEAEYTLRQVNVHYGSTMPDDSSDEDSDGEYKINYVLDGGINHSSNPTSYKKGNAKITLKDPTRTGYKFKGWYSDASFKKKTNTIKKNSTGDYTFYAKWSPIKYSITYNLNKGKLKNNLKNFTVETGEYTLPTPVRDGYRFAGWYTNKNFTGDPITTIDTSTAVNYTVFARWVYYVRYEANAEDATGSMEGMICQSGTATPLAKNQFSRPGYTFKKWTTKPNGKGSRFNDGQNIKENPTSKEGQLVTLYANWVGNPYTIQLIPNGGTGKVKNLSAKYDKAQKLPKKPFKNGKKKFLGWNTRADGSGISYKDGESVKNLATEANVCVALYAQWEGDNPPKPEEKTCTITFNANGGSGAMQTVTLKETDALPANTFVRGGCTFERWCTTADGTGNCYNDQEQMTNIIAKEPSSITLYAQWSTSGEIIREAAKNEFNKWKGNGQVVNGAFAQIELSEKSYEQSGYPYGKDNWCAFYVSKCLMNINVIDHVYPGADMGQKLVDEGKAEYVETPKPGDIVVYYGTTGSKKIYYHVAIVDGYIGGKLMTYQGNVGYLGKTGSYWQHCEVREYGNNAHSIEYVRIK